MNYQLNPMPEPAVNDWETARLEDLRAEVKSLRHFVGSLFMQVKEWTTRLNDLQQTSEQSIALKGDDESKYIALSNTAKFLTDQTMDLSNKVASLLREAEKANNFINNHALQLTELNENITLIMDFLEMSGDEIAPDDTPQPPY